MTKIRFELIILGIIVVVALTGLFLIIKDSNTNANSIYIFGRGGQYSEDAASAPDIDPQTARRGKFYFRRAW